MKIANTFFFAACILGGIGIIIGNLEVTVILEVAAAFLMAIANLMQDNIIRDLKKNP